MNTNIKQIQQIVSLLKQYNIKHLVLSPGTRHVPLVHIVETDNFFKCYSVVDERSAAYFALGLSEALDEPVGFACTSATASCNYMPAMKEAYERGIQLVALTSDKSRYLRFHGASQVINQVDMYKPYTRYAVDLPDVKTKMDEWYCNRCLNEAFLELNHHGKGPIQINFLEPADINVLATFSNDEIPICRKIDRLDNWESVNKWKDALSKKKRILVVCGQYYDKSGKLKELLKKFHDAYNCVITCDNFSNVYDKSFISSTLLSVTMTRKEAAEMLPDLIITYGTKSFSGVVVRFQDKNIDHWDINPDGKVFDTSHSLRTIFETTPEEFFEQVSESASMNDHNYEKLWIKAKSSRDNSIDEFTNFYVAKHVLEALPSGSNVHASVLNSMKFTNMSQLSDSTIATGNICTDGIDGALSTFIGQSKSLGGLSLLVIGDLSYLYDLNASITTFNNNVRILLINNQAGGEFHFNIGKQKISTLDLHIAAGHHITVGDSVGMTNLHYISAHDKEEFESQISIFLGDSERPIMFEVFTNAEKDGASLRSFFKNNTPLSMSNKIGSIISRFMGPQIKNKIKEIIYG